MGFHGGDARLWLFSAHVLAKTEPFSLIIRNNNPGSRGKLQGHL